MANDRRKRVVVIRSDYLKEMAAEARRRHWPLSRVVQLAVRVAMPKIHQIQIHDRSPTLHKPGEHTRHKTR